MLVRNICDWLQGEVLTGREKVGMEVKWACASDLMSHVLANAGENVLLITGLNNLQVVRTAEMSDIEAIIFVQNKRPVPEVLDLAEEKHLLTILTPYSMFTTCGILFKNGLRCCIDDGRK